MNLSSKRAWILAIVSSMLIAAYLLWPEHRAHVFGLFPYAFLLLCPLLHFFHGGHNQGQRALNELTAPNPAPKDGL
jgi:hypothetical protein